MIFSTDTNHSFDHGRGFKMQWYQPEVLTSILCGSIQPRRNAPENSSEVKAVESGLQGEKLGFAPWIEDSFPGDYAKCGSQFRQHFSTF